MLRLALLAASLLPAAAPKVRVSGPVRISPAPLAAPAFALARPALSLSPSAALVPAIQPSPAASAAPQAPKALIQTLTEAPLPKADLPAGEASAAAESDFMARAQLGAVHKGASAVEASGVESSGRSWLGRWSGRSAASKVEREEEGAKMSSALARLAKEPVVELDFSPGPESLKRVSAHPAEVLLTRERGTGVWRLAAGDRHAVADDEHDYDMALHNHVELRMGVYSLYSPYPSPDDLVLGYGKKARLFVISRDGVAEWNADTGYPDAKALRAGLEGSLLGRLVMRVTFPWYYPSLLKRAGVAMELKPWSKVTREWLSGAAAPQNAGTVLREKLADLPRLELAAVAARMRGEALSEAQARAKAVDFKFRVQRWFESFYNDVTEDFTAAPDGVCYRDSRIELFLKPDWRKYPSLTDHFRVLITHEYAHRLQNEGLYTRRWGVEIPAVAVELLRAVELAGLDKLKKGHISFIGEGVLGSFESGRAWARSSSEETMGFYSKGFLAGAAHELALATGRPDDAWEFVRRVSSGKKEESPRAVYAEISGR